MTYQADITATLSIGTPVLSSYIGQAERVGYIAEVQAAPANLYTLGTGKMQKVHNQYVIAFEDLTFDTLTLDADSRMVKQATYRSDLQPMGADAVAELLARCKAATAQRRAVQKTEAEAAAARAAAWYDATRSKIPAGAKAVIVAQMMKDESDAMTDYFHSSVQKTVILAFSTHTRDLFTEMRKAARNYAPTAHLADAPASAENRNKWSMGDGYYLSEGGYKASGWRIRKERLYGDDPVKTLSPLSEWAVPVDAPADEPRAPKAKAPAAAKPDAAPATEAQTIGGAVVSEHVHSTKGFTFYIVQMAERVDRAHFDRLLDKAKAARGWYSRAWAGTPAGFAFKDRTAAETFAGAL